MSAPANVTLPEAAARFASRWNFSAFGGRCTSARTGITRAFVLVAALAALSARVGLAQAAQTYPGPPTIEQLARQADLVVVGEVTATAGEWDAARTRIYTRVHLRPREVLKGAVGSPLSFTRLGGQVGDRVSAVGGAASFDAGEQVLVFLARQPGGDWRLSDLIHGKFSIERDAATGREYATRFTGAPSADRFALDQVRAEVRRTLGG
jgi:hypothetical protein